jgi:hypothetical protein
MLLLCEQLPLADLYSGASRTIPIWTQRAGAAGGLPVREPKDVDIVIEPGMRSGATVVLRGEQVSSQLLLLYKLVLLLFDSACGTISALPNSTMCFSKQNAVYTCLRIKL